MKFILCTWLNAVPVTQWLPRISLLWVAWWKYQKHCHQSECIEPQSFHPQLLHKWNDSTCRCALCICELLPFTSAIAPWLSQLTISKLPGAEQSSHRKLYSHRPFLAACICVMYSTQYLTVQQHAASLSSTKWLWLPCETNSLRWSGSVFALPSPCHKTLLWWVWIACWKWTKDPLWIWYKQ